MKNRVTKGPRGGRGGSGASQMGRSDGAPSVGTRSQARKNVEVTTCGTCEKDLGDDEVIGCDDPDCGLWVHATEMCTGLTQDMLDAIHRFNGRGIKFECIKCQITASTAGRTSELGQTESRLLDMVAQLYQQLRGICGVVQGLADQVKTLTAELKDRTPSSGQATHPQNVPGEQPPRTYASMAASPQCQSTAPSEDYRKMVREELRELEEQRKRRSSLVIRGLGAASAVEAVKKFEDISEHLINEKVSLTDVVKIQSESDLYRGKIINDDLRKKVLDRAKHLKGSDQYNDVFIRRDLTYNQRQELKARRAALATGPTGGNRQPLEASATGRSEQVQVNPVSDRSSPDHPAGTVASEQVPGSDQMVETVPKQVDRPSNE